MSARRVALIAAAAAIIFTGCSQKYAAERDGKKLGHAICDLHNATTAEDASDAKADIANQLGDIQSKLGRSTNEDRKDIEENIADLAEHTVQGNDALQSQDLAVIRRSIKHIVEDSDDVTSAAWEGVTEGLSDCDS
jgi:hypothetical protein